MNRTDQGSNLGKPEFFQAFFSQLHVKVASLIAKNFSSFNNGDDNDDDDDDDDDDDNNFISVFPREYYLHYLGYNKDHN